MRNLSVNRSDSGETVKVEFADAVSVAEIFSRVKEVKEWSNIIHSNICFIIGVIDRIHIIHFWSILLDLDYLYDLMQIWIEISIDVEGYRLLAKWLEY